MGLWLGLWSWSYIASLSIGFLSGAVVINHLSAEWGFYVTIIVMASVLVLNIIAPETRRSAFRRSFREYVDSDEKIRRKVARGEAKLHISATGPAIWWEEVWAGIVLSKRMLFQCGFSVMALYVGWIYAQIVLVIVVCFHLTKLVDSETDRHIAAWRAALSRLQFSSKMDRRWRLVNRIWRPSRNASFQGRSLQS